jgi:uncharacterized SAM-binding protein YcdF (DUF218 family)
VTIARNIYDAGACLYAYLAMPAEAPATADCVIVLGSKYLDVARFTGELCARQGYPLIIFSGNRGRNTAAFASTEAETFERIARPFLPATTKVLLEKGSTNTGDNIRFSKRLLAEKSIECRTFLLIQNPTMTRRALATFEKECPGVPVTCLPPDRTYDDYLSTSDDARSFLDDLVGNVQRILVYPRLGYQTVQPVPEEVLTAYRFLLSRGFDRQLLLDLHGIRMES